MEVHFCYMHQVGKAVADLRILFCKSPADLAKQVAALMNDYPLARVETVCADCLGDPGGMVVEFGEGG